jgi:hypothetical protein
MNATFDEFEEFKRLLDSMSNSDISEDDRAFLLASTWTLTKIPRITDSDMYNWYAKMIAKIKDQHLKGKDDFLRFSRSREGMLSTALGSRMIEWEESQPGG